MINSLNRASSRATFTGTNSGKPLIGGTTFSHGTMECRDPIKTQKFLTEFLGLHSVRKSENTQYVWCGGRWFIACLNVSPKIPPRQGEEYRFALLLGSTGEVEEAHQSAIAQKAHWEIMEVQDLNRTPDSIDFNLRDLNGTWWEIYWRKAALGGRPYDDIFSQKLS